jgi:hypothetical protein
MNIDVKSLKRLGLNDLARQAKVDDVRPEV